MYKIAGLGLGPGCMEAGSHTVAGCMTVAGYTVDPEMAISYRHWVEAWPGIPWVGLMVEVRLRVPPSCLHCLPGSAASWIAGVAFVGPGTCLEEPVMAGSSEGAAGQGSLGVLGDPGEGDPAAAVETSGAHSLVGCS